MAPAGQVDDASPGASSRMVALGLGSALIVLGTTVTALDLWYVRSRPPCPDGYVRLVDIGPVLYLAVGLAVCLVGVVTVVLARRPGAHRALAAVAGVVVIIVAIGVVALAIAIHQLAQQTYDPGCWTF
jgi:hypothetical protein